MSDLTDQIADALWDAFEAADNCFTDREMDVIDTGGNYESFRMRQVAQCLIAALGLAEERETIPRVVKEFHDDGSPAMHEDMVVPVQKSHFEFVPSTRLTTAWRPVEES